MIRLHPIQFKCFTAQGTLTGLPLIDLLSHRLRERPNVQMLFLAGEDIGIDACLAGDIIIHDQLYNLFLDLRWIKFRILI